VPMMNSTRRLTLSAGTTQCTWASADWSDS